MHEQMERAVAEVAKLPDEEQGAIGAWLLEELAGERRWEEAFAGSQPALRSLADEALKEHQAGRTRPLDPSGL